MELVCEYYFAFKTLILQTKFFPRPIFSLLFSYFWTFSQSDTLYTHMIYIYFPIFLVHYSIWCFRLLVIPLHRRALWDTLRGPLVAQNGKCKFASSFPFFAPYMFWVGNGVCRHGGLGGGGGGRPPLTLLCHFNMYFVFRAFLSWFFPVDALSVVPRVFSTYPKSREFTMLFDLGESQERPSLNISKKSRLLTRKMLHVCRLCIIEN